MMKLFYITLTLAIIITVSVCVYFLSKYIYYNKSLYIFAKDLETAIGITGFFVAIVSLTIIKIFEKVNKKR